NRGAVLFCAVFGALLGAAYPVLQSTWVRDTLITPYCEVLAAIVAACLRVVGEPVIADGGYIRAPSVNLVVVHECTGLFAMTSVAAALVAFPARMKARALGAALLLPGLWVVN